MGRSLAGLFAIATDIFIWNSVRWRVPEHDRDVPIFDDSSKLVEWPKLAGSCRMIWVRASAIAHVRRRRAVRLLRVPYCWSTIFRHSKLFSTSTALVPPNANEFESMIRVDWPSRAAFGT